MATLTKQRILQIIKEELNKIKEDTSGNQPQVDTGPDQKDNQEMAQNRIDLGVKMIEAGNAIKVAKNIDPAEAQLIQEFLNEIIGIANEENAKTPLMAALKLTKQKLGTDK